jgi:hypothetical protein
MPFADRSSQFKHPSANLIVLAAASQVVTEPTVAVCAIDSDAAIFPRLLSPSGRGTRRF